MPRLILAALAVAVLAGCADLGYGTNGPRDARRTPDRRAPRYDTRSDDYRRTSEYRRVDNDAANYARYVDRHLRLGRGDEAAIRQIVPRRAVDLLRRTAPRDHGRVYPFPRTSGRQTGFWNAVDRDVERRLDRRERDDYRYLVRYGERRYQDRRSDDRRHDDRGRDDRRHDDGERGRSGSGDRDRDDRDDDDRARGDDDRRRGESLEDWYRRQARRPRG